MGRSGIEWTEVTWNPFVGCSPASVGCRNCYAARMAKRLEGMGKKPYQGLVGEDGHYNGTVRRLPERLGQPKRWKEPCMVFVGSMGDLFHLSVPRSFIVRVFDAMRDAPQHRYQILTKRSRRLMFESGLGWTEKIWAGVTVERRGVYSRVRDIQAADELRVRFLSCEPLLGPLDKLPLDGIHWVIVGGESGPGARLCKVDWIRSIRDQCKEWGVPVFVKQLGAKTDCDLPGQRGNGRCGNPDDWPEDLRVREFPRAPLNPPVGGTGGGTERQDCRHVETV